MTTVCIRHDTGVVEVLDKAAYHRTAQTPDIYTCGECGRSWDDAVVTSCTPTPAARCPFEDEHIVGRVVRRLTQRANPNAAIVHRLAVALALRMPSPGDPMWDEDENVVDRELLRETGVTDRAVLGVLGELLTADTD